LFTILKMRNFILKIIFLAGTIICASTIAYGQERRNYNVIDSRWKTYIDLNEYLVPFWKADTVFDEITQVIKTNGTAQGTLLFNANKILSVKAANHSKEFAPGKDWVYKNGKLVITPNSNIPFIAQEDLLFTKEKPGMSMTGSTPGSFVLFSESNYFRSMQIAVTYIPKKAKWSGPKPAFAGHLLGNTISKLKNKDSLKVVFYGNSIETGSNSSGFQNDPPFMPSWPQLIIYNMRHVYGDNISFSNKSVGGKLAKWGTDNVDERLVPEKPDLVIIGFGMNDGTAKIPPDMYRENIQGIIDHVLTQNPKAEFILIAPMLPNPNAKQNGLQTLYKKELDKLMKNGIVVADLTGVHAELLKHKSYQDMTGNNVNHPNDYLARWYAQFISGLLIK
jgi:lysophospholipase L1-like esterase